MLKDQYGRQVKFKVVKCIGRKGFEVWKLTETAHVPGVRFGLCGELMQTVATSSTKEGAIAAARGFIQEMGA